MGPPLGRAGAVPRTHDRSLVESGTQPIQRIRRYAARVIRRASQYLPRRVPIEYGDLSFEMYGDWGLTAGVGKDYPRNGCHEPMTTGALLEALAKMNEPVFWDVGASYGYFSLITAAQTDPGNIYAFEAGAHPAGPNRILALNNETFAGGKIKIIAKRVSDSDAADSVSLDTFHDTHGCPDIVKIDVDGAETEVLDGMKNVVAHCRPWIFLELHFGGGRERYRRRTRAFEELFSAGGYAFSVCLNHREFGQDWLELDGPGDLVPWGTERRNGDYLVRCVPEGQV